MSKVVEQINVFDLLHLMTSLNILFSLHEHAAHA